MNWKLSWKYNTSFFSNLPLPKLCVGSKYSILAPQNNQVKGLSNSWPSRSKQPPSRERGKKNPFSWFWGSSVPSVCDLVPWFQNFPHKESFCLDRRTHLLSRLWVSVSKFSTLGYCLDRRTISCPDCGVMCLNFPHWDTKPICLDRRTRLWSSVSKFSTLGHKINLSW